MEINDNLTFRLHTPLSFVLANGDSSKATISSMAHLQEKIYGDSANAENKP